MMASRGTSAALSRAARMRQKLQSALEASALEIDDVSYQHAGPAAVKDNANETHFNIKVVSVTNVAPFMPFRVILVIVWQHNQRD